MPQPTSTVSSAEAEAKRALLLEAAASEAVVASSPPTVRWLLCGRGRPVSASSPDADYTVVLRADEAFVLFPDIEASRVASEERFEELGFEPVAFPWHAGTEATLRELLAGSAAFSGPELETVTAHLRQRLNIEEVIRYRAAGADAAEAIVETIGVLTPATTEIEAAGALAARLVQRGFYTPVLLAAGEERQRVHRHPLPTDAALGRHALLAATADRDGLHVSLTRIAAFGRAPTELVELCRAAAAIDAAMLLASRPGSTLGTAFAEATAEYERQGFADEWRRHHQGGLTGYRGREVFATPGCDVVIPDTCAVAWNPSITGGAKSEDTALVTAAGVEVVTRTADLPEFDLDGLARPAVVEL